MFTHYVTMDSYLKISRFILLTHHMSTANNIHTLYSCEFEIMQFMGMLSADKSTIVP